MNALKLLHLLLQQGHSLLHPGHLVPVLLVDVRLLLLGVKGVGLQRLPHLAEADAVVWMKDEGVDGDVGEKVAAVGGGLGVEHGSVGQGGNVPDLG